MEQEDEGATVRIEEFERQRDRSLQGMSHNNAGHYKSNQIVCDNEKRREVEVVI